MGIAYRLTGSVADADDVVQDAWLRWNSVDRDSIDRPEAWLTTVVTRLALDRLRSATARRVSYVGPWLPEPIVQPLDQDPAELAELADSLTFAFLTMLDTLTPAERVAVVLSDVFAMPAGEVAEVLDRSSDAVRQLTSRGRAKLRARDRGVEQRTADRHGWSVASQLLAAVASGDVAATAALLRDDVVLVSDGGPNRHAARRPVVGADRAARFLCNLYRRWADSVEVAPATINARAGIVVSAGGVVQFTMTIGTNGDRVDRLWLVSNPDKLAALAHGVELV